MLAEVFRTIATERDGTMSRNSFIKFIRGQDVGLSASSLGVVLERLFAVLNASESGVLKFTEYLEGLSVAIKGSENQKQKMCFALYVRALTRHDTSS